MSGPVTADYLDTVAYTTGIPAATLRGLRDGSLVAVPREPTKAMLRAVGECDDKHFAWGNAHGADFETLWAVALAAAQEPPR